MEYRFLTTWLLEVERERAGDAIYDSEAWPAWWRGVERVSMAVPGEESVMANGAEGIAELLGCRLLASD